MRVISLSTNLEGNWAMVKFNKDKELGRRVNSSLVSLSEQND